MDKKETKAEQEPVVDHSEDAEGFDHGEPNAAVIGIVGGVIVLMVVVVIYAVQYVYTVSHDEQVEVKVAQPVAQDLLDLHAKEDGDLYQYKYLDRTKGRVRLPIDRAMELLVKESAEGRLKYPTAPAPIKTAEELAAGAAPAAGTPQAAPNANATPGKTD